MNAAEIRARYSKGLSLLPRHMHEGVRHYMERGRETGGFLMAMLRGDAEEAHARADGINRAHEKDWIRFLAEFLPAECHGTPEKMKAWMERGGLQGITPENDDGEINF